MLIFICAALGAALLAACIGIIAIRTRLGRLRELLAALLVCTVSGCSFMFTSAPRGGHPAGPGWVAPSCSTSRVAPVVDSLVGLTGGALALAASNDVKSSGEDGNPGAAMGAVVGVLIFIVPALSAGYGFRNADRCEAARTPTPVVVSPAPLDAQTVRALINRHEPMDCRHAFQALADGRFLELRSLPAGCGLADAEAAFPSLTAVPAQALRQLGRGRHDYDVHVTTTTRAGSGVRVWLEHDAVVAVHITRPILPLAWPELRELLGAPDAKVDSRTGDRPMDQSVYAARGLAVVALDDAVGLVALFPAISVADYEEHLALGVEP